MKSYILLENMVFYANHGVLEQETRVGNEFVVNLRLGVNLEKSGATDDLADTVSYADVYADVKKEMMIPSKLLEHVAYRIIHRLKEKYSLIENVEIKLSKRTPPVNGQLDYASVIISD